MKTEILLILLIINTIGYTQKKFTYYDERDGKNYGGLKINSESFLANDLRYNNKLFYSLEEINKVCPDGYHLPTYNEFSTFFEQVKNLDVVVFFNLELNGVIGNNGTKFSNGEQSIFWLSDKDEQGNPLLFIINKDLSSRKHFSSLFGNSKFCVRCIEDSKKETQTSQEKKYSKGVIFDSNKTYSIFNIEGHKPFFAKDISDKKGNYIIYEGNTYYDFDTAQTICPKGYRLPTTEEFSDLFKSISSDEDYFTEKYLNIKLNGAIGNDGLRQYFDLKAFYWTSDVDKLVKNAGVSYMVDYTDQKISWGTLPIDKNAKLCVRCIQN